MNEVGDVAQLEERDIRIVEARGSSPLISKGDEAKVETP